MFNVCLIFVNKAEDISYSRLLTISQKYYNNMDIHASYKHSVILVVTSVTKKTCFITLRKGGSLCHKHEIRSGGIFKGFDHNTKDKSTKVILSNISSAFASRYD
jgi:hypothetical protein